MTRHKKELMECARMLKLGNLTEHLEELLHQAQEKQLTYPEFLLACLREEVRTRENRKYLCRLKAAGLPARHDLDRYDLPGRKESTPESCANCASWYGWDRHTTCFWQAVPEQERPILPPDLSMRR